MKNNNGAIGIFDSGIGGLSVLHEARKALPSEDFIYLGDEKNFPYGDKKAGELKKIVVKNIGLLVGAGCKAIVVACNTATSVAISDLRKRFGIPIIGMEPAIKPALEGKHKKVLVLATPVTLKLEKFNRLKTRLDRKDDLIVLPARGLASLIEKVALKGLTQKAKKDIEKYLERLFKDINKKEISTIVLGCTHYVFIKDLVQELFPGKKVIDGNQGTVQYLKMVLEEKGLLRNKGKGEVRYL